MDPRIDGNSFGKGTAKTFEDGFKHMMGIAAVRDIDMQGQPALDRKGAKKIFPLFRIKKTKADTGYIGMPHKIGASADIKDHFG